jgi:hypothetical protein
MPFLPVILIEDRWESSAPPLLEVISLRNSWASMLQQRRAWAEALHLSPDLAETLFHHLVAYFTAQELKQWQHET